MFTNQDSHRRFPGRLRAATLFLLLMWLFFHWYQPWQPAGEDLLRGHGGFQTDPTGDWHREQGRLSWQEGQGVTLQPHTRFRHGLQVGPGVDALLVRSRVKTRALEAGRRSWDGGRVLLYFVDVRGRVNWRNPHDGGVLEGDNDWRELQAMIPVPPGARLGWIELYHAGSAGLMQVSGVTVLPVVWKSAYHRWQALFGMLWGGVLVMLMGNLRLWQLPWGKTVVVIGALIILGVALPPDAMYRVTSEGAQLARGLVADWRQSDQPEASLQESPAPTAPSPAPESGSPAESGGTSVHPPAPAAGDVAAPPDPGFIRPGQVQKAGHVFLFALLGLFTLRTVAASRRLWVTLYALGLFALATEALQLVVEGRQFGLHDLLLDLMGLVPGALLGWLWGQRQRVSPFP